MGLKSANEEYQSLDGELQRANEDVETCKQELQSVNEALPTVNGELSHRVQELGADQQLSQESARKHADREDLPRQ